MGDAPIGGFRGILKTNLKYSENRLVVWFWDKVSDVEIAFERFRLKLRRRSVCEHGNLAEPGTGQCTWLKCQKP